MVFSYEYILYFLFSYTFYSYTLIYNIISYDHFKINSGKTGQNNANYQASEILKNRITHQNIDFFVGVLIVTITFKFNKIDIVSFFKIPY